MPFNSTQQAKLDAAQQRLDAAKSEYNRLVELYNEQTAEITPCYNDPVPDATAASTWFNAFSKGPCKGAGSCQVAVCKGHVDNANGYIPQLKNAYNQRAAAQTNYDQVFSEVVAEAQADPQFQLDQLEIEENADANRLKQWFWIILLLLAAAATFIYFKWFRKKKQA